MLIKKTKKIENSSKKKHSKAPPLTACASVFLFSSAAEENSWTKLNFERVENRKKQSDKFLRQLDNCHTLGGEEEGKEGENKTVTCKLLELQLKKKKKESFSLGSCCCCILGGLCAPLPIVLCKCVDSCSLFTVHYYSNWSLGFVFLSWPAG